MPTRAASTLLTVGGDQVRHALRQKCRAYWKLDGASGTRLDATGRGNDLTDTNTVTQAGGIAGSAAQFTAANSESLVKTDTADLSVAASSTLSLAGWVFFDTTGALVALVSKGLPTGAGGEYEVVRNASDQLVLRVRNAADGAAAVATFTTLTLAASTWYFWVASVTAADIRVSVNGLPAVTTAHTAGVLDAANDFALGVRGGGTGYLNGRLDEVGLYTPHLSQAEAAWLARGRSLYP